VKPAKSALERQCGKVLVRADRTRCQPRVRHLFGAAEPLGRQPDHHAGDAAVAHQQVRPDADRQHRDLFGQHRKERREVVFVHRLEQELRRATRAKPGHL
jgi:hypothetical protein